MYIVINLYVILCSLTSLFHAILIFFVVFDVNLDGNWEDITKKGRRDLKSGLSEAIESCLYSTCYILIAIGSETFDFQDFIQKPFLLPSGAKIANC